MAGEWRDVALEDVADELTVGYVGPMASEYVDEGIPFLRSLNVDPLRINKNDLKFITPEFHRRIRKSRLSPGDVVIVRTGKPGACSVVPEWLVDANCSDLVIVRCGPQLDNRFLAYYVNTVACDHVAAHLVGAVQQHFNVGSARALRLNLPPLAEQKAIAAVLGALDDKIELNRRMNATLEAMARALFQSWFIDFDPVRAKLDGRQPFGMDQATAALFPDSFDDSAAGHFPHGWQIGSIYQIANVIYGAPFASSLFNSAHVGKPLIRIRDLPTESPAVFTTEVHPKGYLLQPGDIAVGMDGEFRAFLWAGVESWLNQRVCVFAPKSGYSAAFVRNSIMAPLAEVEATETATTVIHLGKNDIDRFTVIIPDSLVAEAFKQQCQPWYDKIVANKQESRTLATLRDTLLPKLLSGELSVASVESKL
jgi:type I restriction enzyme S subunit